MTQHFFLQDITLEAKTFIIDKIRVLAPIFPMHSNVSDIYNADLFREEHQKPYPLMLSCFLDTNIVSILNDVYRKKDNSPLNEAQTNACTLMSFLAYAGIEANPTLAFFERPKDSQYPSREEDDLLFRLADHLPPQVFADLAMGKKTQIPASNWETAKYAVNSCQISIANIENTQYTRNLIDEAATKILYTHILKALIIRASSSPSAAAFSAHLKWIETESLLVSESLLFIVSLFAETDHAALLKKRNSQDPEVLKTQSKNTATDLAIVRTVRKIHSESLKENKHTITLFSSFDKKLLTYFENYFEVACEESYIEQHISKGINTDAAKEYKDTCNRIMSKNRKQHAECIYSNLSKQIATLEKQLSNQLNLRRTP